MPGEAPSVRESLAATLSSSAPTGADAGASSVPSSAGSEAPAQSVQPSTLGGKEIPTGQDTSTAKGAVRGPDGKFQPKTAADPAQQAAAPVQANTPDPAKKPEDATAAAAPILKPNGWGKEHAEAWTRLPRDLQEVVEKRERERDRALHQERNKLQTQLRNFDTLNQVLQPRAQQLAIGGGPAAVIGRLFALSDAADQNPAAFIQWFAKERGVELASLVAGSSQQAQVDPTVKALQDELARQRRVISEMANTVRGGQQSRESEQQNAMLQTIERWSGEKEADGSLKRPYFERLENHVLALLPQARQANPTGSPMEWLNDAYDAAVFANSETRAAVLQQQETKREQERQRQAAAAAQAAKTAGVSISGGTAPNAGSVPLKSVGAELRRVRDTLRGGRAA